MITSLALGSATALGMAAVGPFGHGPVGLWWLWFLIPLFWILVFAAVFALIGRLWRRRAREDSAWRHAAAQASARSAEATLAERFAQGDIDEKDYRARLEVLRANTPTQS